MYIVQELSGQALYNLSVTEDIGSLPMWKKLNFVVLIDTVRFDAQKKLHFYNPYQSLMNCETYLPILKKLNQNILIEICYYMFADRNYEAYFRSICDFIKTFKLQGVKLKFEENTILIPEFIDAFNTYFNRTLETVIIDLPDLLLRQDVAQLIDCVDFILLRAQGHFMVQYCNEIYGQRFMMLGERNDRNCDLIEISLNKLLTKVGPRKSQILLDIATTCVKFEKEGGVVKVTEHPRNEAYLQLLDEGITKVDDFRESIGSLYFDHHKQIWKKLQRFIKEQRLMGVYLQDLQYDLAPSNPKSILKICCDFNQSAGFVDILPRMRPSRGDTLQVQGFFQELPDRPSNPVGISLQQADKQ